ncbi:uncharacterized protein LACBIDRAFT_310733 [Laccaria bicolor S238N-H82]|uniref:Predicted protein n=1 Tax=Laccaria bicolor (strain S238N-H82 / ATCC MYA-4686) TaxID=486041 RepID=B0DUZ8_LACBS|nr:uncharacterized protein LACBIDRAFT_310733 [Laccaria bicolor S238N-H82]EDR01628.1 predicted protein [Laccaria bicolor S238N-H82]|eukprot:XP_001887704.1 predicted protein [Laccaria bicolor S238N-H82]
MLLFAHRLPRRPSATTSSSTFNFQESHRRPRRSLRGRHDERAGIRTNFLFMTLATPIPLILANHPAGKE